MSGISLPNKALLLAILLVGLAFIFLPLTKIPVHPESIKIKQGPVAKAECVNQRTLQSIKFIANYDGVPTEDFVVIPLDLDCPSLVKEMLKGGVEITYSGNRYWYFIRYGRLSTPAP